MIPVLNVSLSTTERSERNRSNPNRPSRHHILLVEDEFDLQVALSSYLRFEGYDVTTCDRGDQVLATMRDQGPFDLILLDVMLPGQNGFEVLRQVRAQGTPTPIIMVTAKGQHEDVVSGFDAGADDYVSKPFSADVLHARINAILSRAKRTVEKPMDEHQFGDVYVNFTANEANRGGKEVDFTALEYQLLRYLINHKGRVVTRKQLLRDVWDLPADVNTRTVDRHIASLRKKIESGTKRPKHIQTVYGQGYRFVTMDPNGNSGDHSFGGRASRSPRRAES